MSLAKDILKNRDAILEGQATEAASYSTKAKTANTTVPLDEARRRVTNSLGEITRRKTDDKNVVELLSGTKVVGKAEAVYKTKTQRSWTVTIGDVVLTNQHTINKALRAFDNLPKEAEVIKAKPKTKSKKVAQANG